mmetsp:Transcript_36417/g.54380  ORF Transcript_36417/g.54380 Transcript_36417/m.54380 type:complete len:149 (+) Transcript_36417:733-1179(+)
MASQTNMVPDDLWNKASSWYMDPIPGFTVRTLCSSSPPHKSALSLLLLGRGFIQDGSPKKLFGKLSGNAYIAYLSRKNWLEGKNEQMVQHLLYAQLQQRARQYHAQIHIDQSNHVLTINTPLLEQREQTQLNPFYLGHFGALQQQSFE